MGVRLPVESVAELVRVNDGDTKGEAMLDAWTGFGLGAGCVVRGVIGGGDDDSCSRGFEWVGVVKGRCCGGGDDDSCSRGFEWVGVVKGRCCGGRMVLYEGGRVIGFV